LRAHTHPLTPYFPTPAISLQSPLTCAKKSTSPGILETLGPKSAVLRNLGGKMKSRSLAKRRALRALHGIECEVKATGGSDMGDRLAAVFEMVRSVEALFEGMEDVE
jgi:hypothetical protein